LRRSYACAVSSSDGSSRVGDRGFPQSFPDEAQEATQGKALSA
jgi:hypothetical protein